jgi:hypothetical protein
MDCFVQKETSMTQPQLPAVILATIMAVQSDECSRVLDKRCCIADVTLSAKQQQQQNAITGVGHGYSPPWWTGG